MSLESEFLDALEVHAPDQIRALLARGVDPVKALRGRTPVESLIEGYLRSPRFSQCLRVLFDAGASAGDPLLEALLLDDERALQRLLSQDSQLARRKLSIPCAFTNCQGVEPLHICAEFNSTRCAGVLLKSGADVDAAAGFDADGFGGQTAIFHAVNSILNFCRPMLEMLVDAGARLDIQLNGLIWGPGADWETLVLDVTPLSYAQCGLYSQFHRNEADVYDNLALLFERRHATALKIRNVPNRYLAKS